MFQISLKFVAWAAVACAFTMTACGTDEESTDGGVGGSGAGGAAAGGAAAGGAAAGGSAAGGEAAGGAAAGGDAAGGAAAGGEAGPPPDPTVTLTWNGDNPVLDITTSAENGPYQFGLAETGPDNGWMGEDCLEGVSNGTDVCHSVPADGHLELMHMSDPADVADGMTLLGADMAPGLTYVLIRNSLEFQGCWTWGEDTSIYVDIGCDIISP